MTYQHEREEKEDELREIISEKAERITELEAEITALREDKARLDWLEHEGFATRADPDKIGVHCWRLDKSTWRWTAHRISSEFTTARAAIDAARKEDKG